MLRDLTRRPSIAVAAWGVLVLGLFVLRGDLRVSGDSTTAPAAVPPPSVARAAEPQPVIVRRDAALSPAASAPVERTARVYDSMGFLVVGAEVVPESGAPRRTDAEGSFAVELDGNRAADFLVRADGRRPQWLRWTAGSPEPLLARLEPSAPWDAAPLPPTPLQPLRGEGTVRGPDGSPLAFAFVQVADSCCWARADEIGRFVLPLPSESVSLLVHQPDAGAADGGFAAGPQPFTASRGRGVVPLPELVAEPALALHGTVRGPRGQPLAGVPVEVRGGGLRRWVETGSGGAFRVAGLARAEYRIEPYACRGAIGTPAVVRIDRRVVDCDLQLTAAPEQRLRVVDEVGNARANVWVASNSHGVRRGVAQADADGYVSVPIPPAVAFEVRAAETFAGCAVRHFDADASPATLVVAAP